MKKVLMTLFVMFAVVTAYAQEMYIGGGISLWRTQREHLSLSVLILAMNSMKDGHLEDSLYLMSQEVKVFHLQHLQ